MQRTSDLVWLYVGLSVATALVLSACSSSSSRSVTGEAHYSDGGFAFEYPAAWERQAYEKQSSFSSAIVFLSTGKMHEPCVTTSIDGGRSTTCGWPVESLEENGVVVEWSANGFPGRTLADQDGEAATISRRSAKILRETPGDCGFIGGDITITAMIPLDAPDNWYQMKACLKGPDLATSERLISEMLASAELGL